MIMHMEYNKKSNKLIILASILAVIGIIFSLRLTTPMFVNASETTVLGFLYVKDNCSACDDFESMINTAIGDSDIIFTVKNTSLEANMSEYKEVLTNCELTSTPYPLFLSENGCFTDKAKVKTEVEEQLALYNEIDSEEQSDAESLDADSNLDQETSDENQTEDNSENSDDGNTDINVNLTPSTQENSAKDQDTSTNDPFNPILLLISLGFAGFMFWAGFYIIKKFSL